MGDGEQGGNGDVLVVEDDEQINELVGAYAQIAGFGYRRALDGAEALRAAQEAPPALIILDLMLPDTDGFEVCRLLKTDLKTAAVPIVMLTALNGEEQRRRGLACGAAHYMTKPFNPDRLIEQIQATARKG